MKELTIEQKAKAYDEAIEKARKLYNSEETSADVEIACENIFPELKESEDEKIRKYLIERIISIYGEKYSFTPEGIKVKDIIAWLEKQGEEPKKVSIWKHWKNGIAGNGEGKQIYLIKIGNTYNLSSCLSVECDYIELSELDNLMLEKQGKQKSVKWSNEDEKMLSQIISIIEDANNDLISAENISIYTNWLKSRIHPQLKWKPSELQIEALESATANCAYSEYEDCLKELIKQLKQLKYD